MLRFASSPTGDMHIGQLRTALLNYLVSRQKGEDFIVRIDDTDKEKNVEGKDQEILDIVALFNLEYSQTIYQSQNFRFHSAMALQLLHEKKAFSCFCSSDWLEKKRKEAQEVNKAYYYDDACRNLPAELVIDNTNPFTVRINRPDFPVIIEDIIYGKVSFSPDSVDSFVVMNQDKTPTSDFASAVDDMLNDISMVICDEKDMQSTAREVHVRRQLGYEKEIQYAHLPEILHAQTFSVKSLLEQGYLPEAISNYLISLGNNVPTEIFTLQEAQEWFSLEHFSKESVFFDIDVLKKINQEHLKRMDPKELSRYVGFADAEVGELAKIYLEDVATTKELKAKIAPIFGERNIPQELKESVETVTACIKNAPHFEQYDAFKNYIMQETGIEEKKLIKALRVLMTNTQDGPKIEDVYRYLKNYLGEIVK